MSRVRELTFTIDTLSDVDLSGVNTTLRHLSTKKRPVEPRHIVDFSAIARPDDRTVILRVTLDEGIFQADTTSPRNGKNFITGHAPETATVVMSNALDPNLNGTVKFDGAVVSSANVSLSGQHTLVIDLATEAPSTYNSVGGHLVEVSGFADIEGNPQTQDEVIGWAVDPLASSIDTGEVTPYTANLKTGILRCSRLVMQRGANIEEQLTRYLQQRGMDREHIISQSLVTSHKANLELYVLYLESVNPRLIKSFPNQGSTLSLSNPPTDYFFTFSAPLSLACIQQPGAVTFDGQNLAPSALTLTPDQKTLMVDISGVAGATNAGLHSFEISDLCGVDGVAFQAVPTYIDVTVAEVPDADANAGGAVGNTDTFGTVDADGTNITATGDDTLVLDSGNGISVTGNGGTNTVLITVDESQISHDNIADNGTLTHPQIDTQIGQLQTDVGSNTTNITTNAGGITTLQGDLSTHIAAANPHGTTIVDLDDTPAVAANTDEILRWNGAAWVFVTDLTDLEADVSTNTGNIGTNTSDISTNASNIGTNTTNITTNTNAIAVLQTDKADQADLNTTNTNVGNNTTAISNHIADTSGNPHQVTLEEARLESDALSGQITIAASPTLSTHAATKGYVDSEISAIPAPPTADSDLTNDKYVTGVNTVNGPGVLTLDADDIPESATRKYVTSAEKTDIGTALQPSDNISDLTNDSGYVTTSGVTSVNGDSAAAVLIGIQELDETFLPVTNGTNTSAVLEWDGSAWILGAEKVDVSDIGTTVLAPAGDGSSLTGITAAQVGAATTADINSAVSTHTALGNPHGTGIAGLSDGLSPTTSGQIIEWNGTAWVIAGAKQPAGVQVSTDVTLDDTNHNYLTISGQEITLEPIDLAADVTGNLPYSSVSGTPTISTFGETLIDDADAAAARTTLGVDAAGADNSTPVTLDTTNHDYLSLTGQEVALGPVDLTTDVTGQLPYSDVSGTPTISAYGETLIDDATAADARTTLGVDAAGTDNSIGVTLAGTPNYITILGQEITRNQIDLTTDVTNDLPVADGGTGASNAADARTNLGVDAAGADNSTPVTLAGTPNYITISNQQITRNQIDLAADVTGLLPYASVAGTPSLGTAAAADTTDFATAAQGTKADSAVQPLDTVDFTGVTQGGVAVILEGDSRLTDDRDPNAHTHAIGDLPADTTTTLGTSDTVLPTQNAVKVYVDDNVRTNAEIDARITAANLSPVGHTHPQSDITGLVTDLAAKLEASDIANKIELTDLSVAGDLAYNNSTGEFSFTERTDAEVNALADARITAANKIGLADISVTDAGGDGSLSYDNATGIFTFTGPAASEVRAHISAGGDLSYDAGTGIISFTERTDAQVRGLVSAGGDLSYNGTTGEFSVTLPVNLSDLNDDLAYDHNNISDFDTEVNALIALQAGVTVPDLSGGKIPASQLPSIAISEYLGAVGSQAALTALSGQEGDWAIRTDENKTYIITTGTGSNFSDWVVVATPSAPATDLGNNPGTTTVEITSSTGASTTIPAATTSAAGVMTDQDKQDLSSAVQPAAIANFIEGTDVPTHETKLSKVGSNTYLAVSDHAITVSDVPAGEVSGLATVATSGAYADLTGKPAALSDFTDDLAYDHTDISDFDNEVNTLADARITAANLAAANHTHTKSEITDFNESDYATGAEGDLAASAVQPAAIANFLPSIDEDDMASNSPAHLPTQQSVKAYVDTEIVDTDLGYTASTRVLTSSTGTDVTLPEATTTNSGLMSDTDKTKIDGIATGAEVNVDTDLSYTPSTRELASSTGINVTLPEAGTDPGLMAAADKTKLDGVATGAEVNVQSDWTAGSGDTFIVNKPTALSAFTDDLAYNHDDISDFDAEVNDLADARIGAAVLGDLNDVSFPTTIGFSPKGDILYHNGSDWTSLEHPGDAAASKVAVATGGTGSEVITYVTLELNALDDVVVGTEADNHVLYYDNSTKEWKNRTHTAHLSDVFSTAGATADSVIQWNNTSGVWELIDTPSGSSVGTIGDLTNVNTSVDSLGNTQTDIGKTITWTGTEFQAQKSEASTDAVEAQGFFFG